eukprot:TRINITY_DN579_c0_g1_i1.p1 TRINITY_DN579_c0_g1~~TRINITY_DN579_c0_g1_i1.p1  ORF type:complete len:170 (-),score=37.51 TRINITY_DN579_c0_g1_i1:60-569(-)
MNPNSIHELEEIEVAKLLLSFADEEYATSRKSKNQQPVHKISANIPEPKKPELTQTSGVSKKKRYRTSNEQRIVLEETFKTEKLPNIELREALAKQLNMTPRRIQIWFQNKRAKEKRLRIKAEKEIKKKNNAMSIECISNSSSVSPADCGYGTYPFIFGHPERVVQSRS